MRITLLLSLMILASYVHADDFKLNDGTEYKSATVSRVEPDGIIVIILTGVIKLYFTDLPDAVRQKYHYDPYAARRFAGERPESAEVSGCKSPRRKSTKLNLRQWPRGAQRSLPGTKSQHGLELLI
jgi:hypothetical protein